MDKLEREGKLTRRWKLVTIVRDVECFFSGEVIKKGSAAIRANANKGDSVGKGRIYAEHKYQSEVLHARAMQKSNYKVDTKKTNEPELTIGNSNLPPDYDFSQHIIEPKKPLTWWQKLLNLFS